MAARTRSGEPVMIRRFGRHLIRRADLPLRRKRSARSTVGTWIDGPRNSSVIIMRKLQREPLRFLVGLGADGPCGDGSARAFEPIEGVNVAGNSAPAARRWD